MRSFNPFMGPSRLPGQPIDYPIVYFEDFIGGYTAVDLALANESDPTGMFSPVADRGTWLVSYDTLVADTQLFAPQDAADGGWVTATTDATGGERISAQINGEAFKCALNRRIYFETRVKFTNATQDAFLGLAVAGATDPHASRPAGFIAFTLTADADIEYATGNASTATASADSGADIVAATWVVLAFEWDGIDKVHFYVNGVRVATATATPPVGLPLSPVICVESNGAAEALTVDYILVVEDRAGV
jgi:hypothetical protein